MATVPHLKVGVLSLELGSGAMDVFLVLLEVLQPGGQALELGEREGGKGEGEGGGGGGDLVREHGYTCTYM